MSSLRDKRLWAIVGIGLAIRVALGFAFRGTNHVLIEDIAGERVRSGDWSLVYEGPVPWTYPPLFLGWLAGASWLSEVSGLSFQGLAKLAPAFADVGLALAVYIYLGWRQAAERWRLGGAALVMLGPSFIATSGYQGQIDSVAILPAVVALMIWERGRAPARSPKAGLLLGLGGAVKTVPMLMVLPLLAAARSLRERATLIGTMLVFGAVPLVVLWASGVDLHRVTGYTGVPGWGSLSLVLNPALGWDNLTVGAPPPLSGPSGELTQGLQDAASWITLGALVAYATFVFRYRPALIDATVLLWLVIYAFSPNFFLTYLVWGLPFFIMAGYLTEVALLQAVLVIPTAAYYASLWPARGTLTGVAYVPIMIALWIFWICATALVAIRIAKRHDPERSGMQPPLVDVATSLG